MNNYKESYKVSVRERLLYENKDKILDNDWKKLKYNTKYHKRKYKHNENVDVVIFH